MVPAASPAARLPAPPGLYRDPANGHLGGVCAGLAHRLAVDVLVVRVGVIALTSAGGFGVPLYALAWVVLPARSQAAESAERRRRTPGSVRVGLGAGCLVLAVLLAAREADLWVGDAIAWPLVLTVTGAALVWRQSAGRGTTDPTVARRPRDAAQPAATFSAGSPRDRAAAISRTGFGAALVLGGGLLVLSFSGALESGLGGTFLTALVVLVAVAIVLTPFGIRAARTLAGERAARIRSQERAEVAAHLHDSVLQTLALVQKQAGDPRAVGALARRQERELRTWLSGGPDAAPGERLADALRAAAAAVEDDHGVAVDVVCVGDRPLEADGEALVAATREALVNAARHAGEAGPVSVFAELGDRRAEVFVRDRGAGFDVAAIPEDRRGVRESIVGRMARNGGRATVTSTPGAGTEVELALGTTSSSLRVRPEGERREPQGPERPC